MVAGLLCWSPGLPGIYLRTKREERERAEIKQKDRELIKRLGKRDLSLCLKL